MEKQQNEIFFETKDLTKKFGDVTAVNHVSMAIRTGEIRGLIGENGSGKSTISSMISAIHTVTSPNFLVRSFVSKNISFCCFSIRKFRLLCSYQTCNVYKCASHFPQNGSTGLFPLNSLRPSNFSIKASTVCAFPE